MQTNLVGARRAARVGVSRLLGARMGLSTLAASVALGLGASAARADLPNYQLIGQYTGPAGWNAFDVMPDGRVLFMNGAQFSAADVRNPAAATVLGSVNPALISSFGPAFVSVSPDGATIAIGDNNFGPGASVHVLSTASLDPGAASATTAFAAPNTEACWNGNSLFVSGFGSGPVVTRIDITGGTTQTVITGIGDGNGGVTVRDGRLYVGLGFDASGGSTTGQVRAFDIAAIEVAPVAFASGALVARALSGANLGFDAGGNLLVAGGDFFSGSNDFGAAAVIDGASVAAALAGGAIDPVAAQLRLSPAGSGAFYGVRFNNATSELLVAANGTLYRYAIPTPGAMGLCGLMGVMAARRRRHA